MSDAELRDLDRRWRESGQNPDALDRACGRAGLPSEPRFDLRRRLVRALKTLVLNRALKERQPILPAPDNRVNSIGLAPTIGSAQTLPVHMISLRNLLVHDGRLVVVLPAVIDNWVDLHGGLTIWLHSFCKATQAIKMHVYRWETFIELNVILTPTEETP